MSNPRLRKESIVHLPTLGLAYALAWLNHFGNFAPEWVLVGVIGFGAISATTCLGIEFQYGTMSALLAQPVDRSILWRDKIRPLAVALFIIAALGIISLAQDATRTTFHPELLFLPLAIGVLLLGAGPQLTLLLRDARAALAACLLLPVLLYVFATWCQFAVKTSQ